MKYISTRGAHSEGVSSAYAIKTGLASDGGLFMPESFPQVDTNYIKELSSLDYPERCAKILSLFLTDFTYEELLEDTLKAYSKERFVPSPAPITKLDEKKYMLELWHGPTCAFKDMALQIMPRLFLRSLRKCGEKKDALILVATSGDTGKAALEGYRDLEGIKIQVFYPIDGVSSVQKQQMQTQEGNNVSVLGIKGNFDDAQGGVKKIFSSNDFSSLLNERGVFLSSANSINWGRLVPQIVYYLSSYCDMYKNGVVELGEKIDVCVPTGNFGNIFACFIAKKMGLPIDRLVCASNKNNILTDFINTGIYDRNRDFYTTSSPSMDILISSNLERLIYSLFGKEKCKEYMSSLDKYGKYALSPEELSIVRDHFEGYYADEEQCKETLKRTYLTTGRLIDTHTAVAVSCAERYMNDNETTNKLLVVSTASPYKFAGDVLLSLTGSKPLNDLEAPEALNELTGIEIPLPLKKALFKEAIHTGVIAKENMQESVLDFASK